MQICITKQSIGALDSLYFPVCPSFFPIYLLFYLYPHDDEIYTYTERETLLISTAFELVTAFMGTWFQFSSSIWKLKCQAIIRFRLSMADQVYPGWTRSSCCLLLRSSIRKKVHLTLKDIGDPKLDPLYPIFANCSTMRIWFLRMHSCCGRERRREHNSKILNFLKWFVNQSKAMILVDLWTCVLLSGGIVASINNETDSFNNAMLQYCHLSSPEKRMLCSCHRQPHS